jgi:hypothetical protein
VGFLDKLKSMFGQHADKADSAIDKGADVADDKTGGKYSGQIDKGADAAHDAVDRLTDEGGTQA